MGDRPKTVVIWGVKIEPGDWLDEDGAIRPKWLPYAQEGSQEDGFQEALYGNLAGPVLTHGAYYCGDYDREEHVFLGCELWSGQWVGSSGRLEPTLEQAEAVRAFLEAVGLDKTPGIHAMCSYG